MAFPASQREDLGDDDSFSPDIVSGYHFNVPLARETSTAAPPQHNLQNPDEIETIDVQPVELHYDMGDDDEYFAEEDDSFNEEIRQLAREQALGKINKRTLAREHDHREDAVYDDLDDIGDWVGSSAPVGADLTKRMVKAVSNGLAITENSVTSPATATAAANAALQSHQRTENKRRQNQTDKLDRATVEQVLDPRTRMILFRLLSRNRLRTLDGCVSTGKEANVYYATAASDPGSGPDASGEYPPNPKLEAHDFSPDAGVAVKVFKTSILQFKDRERYVAGEFRFRRRGYQRGSNRKMVQQWAEKEFRNQMRLQEAGIPAPIPLLLKPPILIMSFFGKDGWPAPRLKDANLSPSRLASAYFRVCMIMRRMFRVAHLVHGDLSEYNMLYWKSDVVIIDVSQSVEDDHPMALDFLRRDCANINDFFRRSGCANVLTVRELFDFVTGEHIGNNRDEEEGTLSYLLDSAGSRDMESMRLSQRDDDVFMRSYIPRTLQEVEIRENHFQARDAHIEQSLFARLTGLSIAQKRERASSRSKSVSLSEGSHIGPSEIESVQGRTRISPNPIDAPDLAAPIMEPATFRTLPAQEKQRLRSSSPCTSHESSRRAGGQCDAYSQSGSGALEKASSALSKVDGFIPTTEVSEFEGHAREGDDTFDAQAESASLSSDEWVRQPRAEVSDPYMGMSKKEWKKHVKEGARERRENKTPKHVKKRKEALAKRRRGHK